MTTPEPVPAVDAEVEALRVAIESILWRKYVVWTDASGPRGFKASLVEAAELRDTAKAIACALSTALTASRAEAAKLRVESAKLLSRIAQIEEDHYAD